MLSFASAMAIILLARRFSLEFGLGEAGMLSFALAMA